MLLLPIILSSLIFVNSLTPLSQCTAGFATRYYDYQNGGSCMFGPPKLYGAAASMHFYRNASSCGICYEAVSPKGSLYFMVDSDNPPSTGKYFHFDLHDNAAQKFDPGLGTYNITFRMVACEHKGNIIIKPRAESHQYYYSFTVMNHKIGLKGVSYSYDKKTYKALERTMYNCWEILGGAKFPLYLKLQAISGEIKETVIDSLKPGFEHDTGVQFTVPKDMYFTLDDFKKIDKPKETEKCCKMYDYFTNIYNEGKIYNTWGYSASSHNKINIQYNKCKTGSKKCIGMQFTDYASYLTFYNNIHIDVKRYKAIQFYFKSQKECKECVGIHINKVKWISISSKGSTWEKMTFNLVDLGFKSGDFTGFTIQNGKPSTHIFYLDDIKLIKSDYVDPGKCATDDNKQLDS